MRMSIGVKSLVALLSLVVSALAGGLVLALVLQITIPGSVEIGEIQSSEDAVLLWESIDPNKVALTEIDFGEPEFDAFGNQTNELRVPIWVENDSGVPFELTVEAVNVSPTIQVTGSVFQDPVRLLFGPAGGDLLPSPSHAVVIQPGEQGIFAGEIELDFLFTPQEIGGEGTNITFDIQFSVDDNIAGNPTLPPSTRIVFRSLRDGLPEIYLMNSNGSGQSRVTVSSTGTQVNSFPSLSPAGDRILFVSDRDGVEDIYSIDDDGLNLIRLTGGTTGSGTNSFPDWSPSGLRIAFASTRDGNEEIYLMNADGSGQTRLTVGVSGSVETNTWPSWSPDNRITFSSTRDGNSEIYTMNDDGSGVSRLTNNAASDENPAWSPDGSRIAFTSTRDGNHEIYVMNSDGSGLVRLTNNAASDSHPAWSPDGTQITFQSLRDGDLEVYVMNADGTGVTQITQNQTTDDQPDWGLSPAGGS